MSICDFFFKGILKIVFNSSGELGPFLDLGVDTADDF